MIEIWQFFTQNFNNREIAGAIWFSISVFILLLRKDLRSGFYNIILAILAPRLLILLTAFAGVVAFLAWLGVRSEFWTSDLITPVVVWYFFGGLSLLFRAFDATEGSQHFQGYIKGVLSGAAVIEFLYASKTFGLGVELVLTPLVSFVALMAAYSRNVKEHAAVNKLITSLLVIYMSCIILSSGYQIWTEHGQFFTNTTLKIFLLPIYITIGSTPFFYLVHCYSHIESARTQIDLKTFQSDALKSYAKWRFISTFLLRPWLLRRATRQFHSLPAKEKKDIDMIINEILQHERDEDNPPSYDSEMGWSPFEARELLANEGMRTGDYHCDHTEEEWWGGLITKELDGGHFPNTVNFSYFGVEGLVTKLRLQGHFIDAFVTPETLREFARISFVLTKQAVPEVEIDFEASLFHEPEPFEIIVGETRMKFMHARFPNDKGFELTLELSRPAKA